MSNLLAMLL